MFEEHSCCQALSIIKAQIRIGNGCSVNIGGDKWLTTLHSFKLSFPESLTAFDLILKVSRLIDYEGGIWKQDLIQQHFNAYEVGKILKVPLCDTEPIIEQASVWCARRTSSFSKLKLMLKLRYVLLTLQRRNFTHLWAYAFILK